MLVVARVAGCFGLARPDVARTAAGDAHAAALTVRAAHAEAFAAARAARARAGRVAACAGRRVALRLARKRGGVRRLAGADGGDGCYRLRLWLGLRLVLGLRLRVQLRLGLRHPFWLWSWLRREIKARQ